MQLANNLNTYRDHAWGTFETTGVADGRSLQDSNEIQITQIWIKHNREVNESRAIVLDYSSLQANV